ncbi:MAG: hypothetical protein HY606_11165 [Planctomycetes bacterium]|nr:hypothetical protein [Planctomycetota bacterium]
MKKVKLGLIIFSLTVNLVLIIGIVTLLFTGNLNGDKISKITAVLKGETEFAVSPEVKKDDTEKLYMEYKQKMKERETEVQKMEERLKDIRTFMDLKIQEIDRLNSELSQMNSQLTEKKKQLSEMKKDWENKQKEENFLLNLKRFSNMEPESVADILKRLTDDEVRLYLNNIKPGQAAEVIDVIRQDKEFNERLKKILFDVVEVKNN